MARFQDNFEVGDFGLSDLPVGSEIVSTGLAIDLESLLPAYVEAIIKDGDTVQLEKDSAGERWYVNSQLIPAPDGSSPTNLPKGMMTWLCLRYESYSDADNG